MSRDRVSADRPILIGVGLRVLGAAVPTPALAGAYAAVSAPSATGEATNAQPSTKAHRPTVRAWRA